MILRECYFSLQLLKSGVEPTILAYLLFLLLKQKGSPKQDIAKTKNV